MKQGCFKDRKTAFRRELMEDSMLPASRTNRVANQRPVLIPAGLLLSLLSGCENIQLLLNRAKFSPTGRKFGNYYGYGA